MLLPAGMEARDHGTPPPVAEAIAPRRFGLLTAELSL
jgi:hypothetical protein